MSEHLTFDDVFSRLAAKSSGRLLVAVAGAPGSGKSTFAEALCEALNQASPTRAMVVPMDGFHYDDAVLRQMGLLSRKGAPLTFDVDGLDHLLTRLSAPNLNPRPIAIPLFDRGLELSRSGACLVPPEVEILIVEGNYLLLTEPPWDRLERHFHQTIMLDVPESVLHDRLIARWLGFGYSPTDAREKAEGNDLPNARHVLAHSRDATWVVATR